MNAISPGAFAPDPAPFADLHAPGGLGALGAVEVRLTVEVGAARMTLSALAALGPGATFELDRRTDERIDILVNDQLLAKGEVVALGDRFGVRILELLPQPAPRSPA
jgi:flagellar motor switch protein FliN/FliY